MLISKDKEYSMKDDTWQHMIHKAGKKGNKVKPFELEVAKESSTDHFCTISWEKKKKKELNP
jgi:hypothetical protein